MAPTNITPTKTRQVFVSGDPNKRIVRVPHMEEPLAGNRAREIHPGLVYEFNDGQLVVDDRLRGRDAAFFERWGEKDRDALDYASTEHAKPDLPAEEWLRQHPSFNIQGAWGFHEIGYAKPDSAPTLARVTELLIAKDEDGLLALYRDEEAGHRRPDVLKSVADALSSLEEPAPAA